MRTILNVLWNVPGLGFVAAFFWVLAGLLMAITIIGLPWTKACFTLANYTLAPFGRELASRYDATGREYEEHAKMFAPLGFMPGMTKEQIADLQKLADFGNSIGVVPEKIDATTVLQKF